MRWTFFLLMGANVVLFGWLLITWEGPPEPSQDRVSPQSEEVPPILLIEEATEQQLAAPSPAQTAPAPQSISGRFPGVDVTLDPSLEGVDKELCMFVGPFETVEAAQQLVERLIAMDIDGRVADMEIPAGQGYWVHLEPLESRREALRRLSELQAQGVDSYVIPKGDLMNGISLGMFSQESLAQARAREMREAGLDAKIDVIERTYKEIWVSMPDADARNLGDQAWQRLLESDKNVDRRQNFCLHVASQDNIH